MASGSRKHSPPKLPTSLGALNQSLHSRGFCEAKIAIGNRSRVVMQKRLGLRQFDELRPITPLGRSSGACSAECRGGRRLGATRTAVEDRQSGARSNLVSVAFLARSYVNIDPPQALNFKLTD